MPPLTFDQLLPGARHGVNEAEGSSRLLFSLLLANRFQVFSIAKRVQRQIGCDGYAPYMDLDDANLVRGRKHDVPTTAAAELVQIALEDTAKGAGTGMASRRSTRSGSWLMVEPDGLLPQLSRFVYA